MAMLQKKAQEEQKPRDAEAVFEKLPSRYPVIMPSGTGAGMRLRFEDFNSSQVQPFQVSNVPPEKKDALLADIIGRMNAAQGAYDPSLKDSVFVASNVSYEPKGGVLGFSLRRKDASGSVPELAKR